MSCCRDIPLDVYNAWSLEHERAKAALVDRSAQVDASAEQIERNLLLLGATAIEDKLQQVSNAAQLHITGPLLQRLELKSMHTANKLTVKSAYLS